MAKIDLDDRSAPRQASDPIDSKVAGVTFEGRQTVVRRLRPGEVLQLVREPDNPHDPDAIKVLRKNGDQVGYVEKQLALDMQWHFQASVAPRVAEVVQVTGEESRGQSLGVVIRIHPPSAERCLVPITCATHFSAPLLPGVSQDDLQKVWAVWRPYGVHPDAQDKVTKLTLAVLNKIVAMIKLVKRSDPPTAFRLLDLCKDAVSTPFLLCYYIGYALGSGQLTRDLGAIYLVSATGSLAAFVEKIGVVIMARERKPSSLSPGNGERPCHDDRHHLEPGVHGGHRLFQQD